LNINAKIYLNWSSGGYWNVHDNELLAKTPRNYKKSYINAHIWCIFSKYFCIAIPLDVLV